MDQVVLVQSDAQVGFVLRVILRVAGRSNVRLVGQAKHAQPLSNSARP